MITPIASPSAWHASVGLTLLELLLTLSIIGLICAVGLPVYSHSILTTHRTEAKASLYRVMQQQERFYTQHNAYQTFTADSSNKAFTWWSGDSPQHSYYEISARPCKGKSLKECVLLVATPGTDNVNNHYTDLACGNFMLSSDNEKTTSGGAETCW